MNDVKLIEDGAALDANQIVIIAHLSCACVIALAVLHDGGARRLAALTDARPADASCFISDDDLRVDVGNRDVGDLLSMGGRRESRA